MQTPCTYYVLDFEWTVVRAIYSEKVGELLALMEFSYHNFWAAD